MKNGNQPNGSENQEKKKNEEEKEPKKSFWSWLKKEMKVDTKMLSIKAVIFLFVGGSTSFLPYLTLHMREIGLKIEEIAVIYAVLPVASILGPTISGLIADKTGRYISVLMVNVALTALLHSSMLLVPKSQFNNFVFSCNEKGYSIDRVNCEKELIPKGGGDLNTISLQNCIQSCDSPELFMKICFLNSINSSCYNHLEENKAIIINGTLLANESCQQELNKIYYKNGEYNDIVCPGSCLIKCKAKIKHYEELPSSNKTFYLYFVLRILGTLALASCFTMLDAVVLSKVKETKSGFGKQRMMSMLAQAFLPLFSGLFVDYFSKDTIDINYSPAFFLGDGMLGLTIFILFFMQFKVETTDEKMTKDLLKLISKVEVDVYLLIITFLGLNWGFLETYLFPYLKELNAPTYLLGLTLTVGSFFGLPFMFWSDYIVQKLGQSTMFFLSFIAYFVRFFGYSYIYSPWHCFPFELLEVITYQMMWVAAATYCPILAPPNLLATMTGIAGAAHYSMGKGLGSFLGGYLISWLGLRATFRTLGLVSLGGALLHICAHKFIFQKKIEERKKAAAIAEAEGLVSHKNRNSIDIIEAMKNTSRRNSFAM